MALIMVVDDDANMVRLLEQILTAHGHQVIAATDGIQMIEKAKDLLPQLMIVDLMMPGSYGSAAYKTLQQDTSTASIPAIFLTAVPPDRARAVAPETARTRLLFKPVDVPRLLQTISELLPSAA